MMSTTGTSSRLSHSSTTDHPPLTRLASATRAQLDDLLAIIGREFQSSYQMVQPPANPLYRNEHQANDLYTNQPQHLRTQSETTELALTLDDLFFSSGRDLEQKLLPQPYADAWQSTGKYNGMVPETSDSAGGYHQQFGMVKEELASPQPAFGSSLGSEAGSSLPDFDSASMEIYRDLILKHLVQDISATCRQLVISSDPMNWTVQESTMWLNEMSNQFQLDPVPHQLYLPGCVLATMSQQEFVARAPTSGDTLHAQLQIWKTAAEYVVSHEQKPCSMLPTSAAISVPSTSCSASASCVSLPPLDANNGPRMTLSDWLAQFDPSNDEPLSYLAHSAPARITGRKKGNSAFTTNGGGRHISASNIQNNEHLSQLLPSPVGSDSGISADYDDLCKDGSPNGGVLKVRRHTVSCSGGSTGNIHLWQFIRELLDKPDDFGTCVRWLDRKEGVFKIDNSHQLARLWGQRKNRTKMNYDKLSRSLRQYYKKNIIRKTGQRQRLIYQFIPPYHVA